MFYFPPVSRWKWLSNKLQISLWFYWLTISVKTEHRIILTDNSCICHHMDWSMQERLLNLRIKVFWDGVPWQFVNSYLKFQTQHNPSECWLTIYESTQCNITEDLNHQQHHCQNLESYSVNSCSHNFLFRMQSYTWHTVIKKGSQMSDPVVVHITIEGRWHTKYCGSCSKCVNISKTLT
jgi:hypothetical protein